jgi:predicted KAP-like P-loop ATPase
MFGIGNYISGLCSFITECDTPMTIAIQGDWGSGKTSVMEMVSDSIDKTAVHCVWFNTWQFSQFNSGDSLSLSLIESIVKDMNIDDGDTVHDMHSGLERLGEVMLNVGKRGLSAASDIFLGGTNTAEIVKRIEGQDAPDRSISETISMLKERFRKCVTAALEKNKVRRILVFIDDLDRLEPLRAVELLEVLKIFLDCEKCVFVLALDYNVVVSGVKRRYGADFDAERGRSFFDKIIQVPFKMPVAQYDIFHFVKNTIEEIASVEYDDALVKRIVTLINNSTGSNPRSMKRLFNSFLLLLNVVDKALLESDPNNKRILFATLCMQLRFESLYNHIVINKDGIDKDFFTQLAITDDIEALFKQKGIDLEDEDDVEDIQNFIRSFNEAVTPTGDEESISRDGWEKIKALLNCSSVVSTESKQSGTRKRTIYQN